MERGAGERNSAAHNAARGRPRAAKCASIAANHRKILEQIVNASRVVQRVAIAGLGAIGKAVARKLDEGVAGLSLSAVAVRDPAGAGGFLETLSRRPAVVALHALAGHADIVV